MIPDSFVQELLAKVDIVELIDGMVPLKKSGANHVACCPFHSEKSASFSVSQTKQFYHCFGCQANGSAIGFLMEYQGIGFVDAVKYLADRLSLEVPNDRPVHYPNGGAAPTGHERNKTKEMLSAMNTAADFYRNKLLTSPRAIDYCRTRGLSDEVLARYNIGYASSEWSGLKEVFPEYDSDTIKDAGLVIENESGSRYDRFRDRLMIPIVNQKGEVIGFGGRVVEPSEPKYLNSPETPLFEKGHELFGLPQARQALREKNLVVVTEGYMDVIALSQHGVGNAVATLGTATTTTHIQKLLRQADKIVFCFDGDTAGRKAAARAMENAIEMIPDNKQIAFVFLPEKSDPDDFIRENGKAAFDALVAAAMPMSEFFIREISQRCDLTTAEGKARLVFEAKPLLIKLQAPMLQLQLVKRLADASGLTQEEIERHCNLKKAKPPQIKALSDQSPQPISKKLLRLIMHKPWLANQIVDLDIPESPERQAILLLIRLAPTMTPSSGYPALREALRGMPEESLIESCSADIMDFSLSEEEVDAEFAGVIAKFGSAKVRLDFDTLQAKLRSVGGAAGLSLEERRAYTDILIAMRQPARTQPST